jgi:hypothetical protein
MSRNIKDASKRVTTAFPAQDTTAASAAIDLEQAEAFPVNESLALVVAVPALPDLANDQTATITLQDSANGTDFATLAGLSTVVLTGAGGTGAAAAKRVVRLPDNTRRYVRANVAMSATAGDNTGVSYVLELAF